MDKIFPKMFLHNIVADFNHGVLSFDEKQKINRKLGKGGGVWGEKVYFKKKSIDCKQIGKNN